MKLPNKINIMGKIYSIKYTHDQVSTDIDKRNALWGQVDYHTRSIRVYHGSHDHRRQPMDILDTLIHETTHAIIDDNRLLKNCIRKGMEHDFIDNFSSIIADTLIRNRFIK